MKVAYFSPLPPERTGISEYSELLLPALRRRIEADVVPRGRTAPADADVCLYHVGNNPDAHGWIVEALRRRPGVVVLHDFVLHHLVAGLTLGRRDGPGYLGAMQREAGVAGRLLAHGVLDGVVPPLWEVRPEDFPLAGEVLEHAAKPGGGLIVHSRYVAERAVAAGYDGRLWRIPHPAWPDPGVPAEDVPGEPVVGSFGNINASKRIPQLLEAFAALRTAHPDARLLLVGADLDARLSELPAGVERIDYVDEPRLWALMGACDVCVSLRAPTMGETSGSVIRALALGKPLVVSDVGWFAELPDEVALKVPVDAHEAETLGAALELLAANDRARTAMGDAARAYVAAEHDLDRSAEAYVAALEEATGAEAVRDAVVGEVAEAAGQVGIADESEEAAEIARLLNEVRLGG
jgi:glycosyltransferase involved in cell wall biosynthesis